LIGARMDYKDGESPCSGTLPVLRALQPCPLSSLGFTIGESYAGNRVAGIHPEGSLRYLGEQGILRFLERLHCHFTRHGGKLAEELAQRMSSFKIVDQIFERNTRPAKTGHSVHDVRIDDDCAFSHPFHFTVRRRALWRAGC
jgi:hypothetical protein